MIARVVDPETLLVVRYLDDSGVESEQLAVACSYVPVTLMNGARGIALLILFDPVEPNPQAKYYCAPERLLHTLVAPSRVRQMRPYRM